MTSNNRIAILDAGGQYVDLVRKAVERQGVPADVLPLDTPIANIEEIYKAIIISGSPASSHAEAAPQTDRQIWQSDLPVLGICYGMQAMTVAHGGTVTKNAIREDGRVITEVDTSHPLFSGIKQGLTALFTHGDFVSKLPSGFKTIGQHTLSDGSIAYSAIAKGNKIGVQFHPEVFDDTPEGYQIFKNFLTIAGIEPDKTFQSKLLKELISTKKDQIKKQAGERDVIAFVSGGVDSSVCVTLAALVIQPEKLHGFFIDHGFIRDEDEQVIETLQAAGINVKRIDAEDEFANATVQIDSTTSSPLKEAVDPEIKRKIIGKVFIDIQNRLVEQLNLKEALLLQGTNAADRIESGHSKGDAHTMTIKTHHNQVSEVQEMKAAGLLIEPLDDLFKDEVRELGRELGLPHELVMRQPFPGPGLAIRIIATNEEIEKVDALVEEAKLQEFINTSYSEVSAHLLPIRSVGVGGDERSHLSVVAIEGTKLNAQQLATLGTALPSNFRDSVNRVIYSLGGNKLENLSETKTLLTSEVSSQLRVADRIVFEEMRAFNLLDKITQFPVVLLPLAFNSPGKRSVVLRPVKTTTFMTVQAMLPEKDLPKDFFNKVTSRILEEDPNISNVFLDLTNKPPATTEWE